MADGTVPKDSSSSDGAAESAGRRVVFDSACPHKGCPLGIETRDDGTSIFDCPSHGGQFDAKGAVLRGPPTQPLRPVGMHHDAAGAVWVVDAQGNPGDGAGDGLERADYAVLALT